MGGCAPAPDADRAAITAEEITCEFNEMSEHAAGVTIASEFQHDARRGRSHYVVYMRPDGQWVMTLFSMFTDEAGQVEEKLGDYFPSTLDDAKSLAQGLADQEP